ncbi:DUF1614 domain-containing protein [Natronospora cellulosivora (SeqCode)]
MSLGVILLIIVAGLIYFGIAERVLDRMYLTDSTAILVIVLIIIGSFFDLTISRAPLLSINVGGAIIPFILSIYVITRANSSKEWIRTIVAIVLTAAGIYGISMLFPNFGHGRDIIDPMYIFGIAGGIIAYILGRSRRASFIAGTMGFILYNLFLFWRSATGQIVAEIRIGGAGAFDSIIISGLLAVLIAELVGESRERLAGGHIEENED